MARVLVVDDDEDLLFLISEYLDAYGFDFDIANSAALARRRLKEFRYDAIISDLNMPGETGLDLFRHVSARYPELPFVLMTGCPDSRVKREALRLGVSGYVEKPFHLSDLVRIIATIPIRRGRRSEMMASTA
ncbi:MAG: response regulator [Syntrophobacteraceae bacterium]